MRYHSAPTQQVLLLRVLIEPLCDVPAHRINLSITLFCDVLYRPLNNTRSKPLAAEIRGCEGARERNSASVIAVIKHAHQRIIAAQFIARSNNIVRQSEGTGGYRFSHVSTLTRELRIDPSLT